MSAVAKAYSIVLDAIEAVPREPHDNKSTLLRKAAGVLSLSYWQAKKIRYGEIKTIDADKLESMRENFDSYLQRLSDVKAKADDNQARLNELIYLRHEIAGTRQADRAGNAGAAGRERDPGNRGGDGHGDRPAPAALRQAGR
jgi:hypothetical protein